MVHQRETDPSWPTIVQLYLSTMPVDFLVDLAWGGLIQHAGGVTDGSTTSILVPTGATNVVKTSISSSPE